MSIQMMFSSVPSECVFSTLGNTLSKKRTKIFCKMVDKMVMLKKNMSIEDVYCLQLSLEIRYLKDNDLNT